MKKFHLRAAAAAALAFAALAGCGTILPVEGGSQIIHDVGSQALGLLIDYAESQGWTKDQLRQALQDADVAIDEAAPTRAPVHEPSARTRELAAKYFDAK